MIYIEDDDQPAAQGYFLALRELLKDKNLFDLTVNGVSVPLDESRTAELWDIAFDCTREAMVEVLRDSDATPS